MALCIISIPVIVSTNIFPASGVYDEAQPSQFECLLTPIVSTSYYSSSVEITKQEPPSSAFMTPVTVPPHVVTKWVLF